MPKPSLLLSLLLSAAAPLALAGADEDLLGAATEGDVTRLGAALKQGADADALGDRGTTALMLAAERGHASVVRALIEAGADVNAERPGGITPLMHAAASGDAATVQLLIEAGAEVNARAEDNGMSALRVAVATGSLDAARRLIDAGASRDEQDDAGARLLFTAAARGSVPLLELLLAPGEDVNHKRTADGSTALDVALERHQWAAAQYLIEHGATLAASVTGRQAALRKLLELEPVMRPGRGASLVQAVDMPSAELFRAVLKQGADTSFRDEKGNTLLMMAARRHHVTAVEALLQAGLDVDARNADGDTALAIAAGKTEYEIIVVGIGLALTQDQGQYQDRNTLMRLVFRPAARSHESPSTARRLQAAQLLLAAKADPNAADGQGNTPLMEATRTGDAELVDLLLAAGARVDARDTTGNTPVLLAAQFGLEEIATRLVAARADLSARDSEGRGALDLAREGGHERMVRLLENAALN